MRAAESGVAERCEHRLDPLEPATGDVAGDVGAVPQSKPAGGDIEPEERRLAGAIRVDVLADSEEHPWMGGCDLGSASDEVGEERAELGDLGELGLDGREEVGGGDVVDPEVCDRGADERPERRNGVGGAPVGDDGEVRPVGTGAAGERQRDGGDRLGVRADRHLAEIDPRA